MTGCTPDATWYGIKTLTLSASELDEAGGPAAVTTAVRDRLVELEEQLGLAELDPAGPGARRSYRWCGSAPPRKPCWTTGSAVVDVHRAFNSGAPALAAADKALAPVRWRNRATEWLFFQAPEAVRAAAARNTRLGWKGFVLDWANLAGRGGVRPGRPPGG